jgi:hypothetical protein
MTDPAVVGRVFLVGCPRSGTTLLQSLVAAHPRFTSFPETHYLPGVVPRRHEAGAGASHDPPASPRAARTFEALLATVDAESVVPPPRSGASVREYVEAMVRVLDQATLKRGRDQWLEKTPRHLHFLGHIERWVPDARVLHIVREGPDVVASLFEVTHRHPKEWKGARSIEACVARWKRDVRATLAHVGKPNHLLVRYEDLVRDSRSALERVCGFLGVAFDDAMLDPGTTAAALVRPVERWKERAGDAAQPAERSKFQRLFDADERARILEMLAEPDLSLVQPADGPFASDRSQRPASS